MSTWRFVVSFDWPEKLPPFEDGPGRTRPKHLEDLLLELLDPLNRDNVVWYDARLELARDSDGSY